MKRAVGLGLLLCVASCGRREQPRDPAATVTASVTTGPCSFGAAPPDGTVTNVTFAVRTPAGVAPADVALGTDLGTLTVENGVRAVVDAGGFASLASVEATGRLVIGNDVQAQSAYSELTGITIGDRAHLHGLAKTAGTLVRGANVVIDGVVSTNATLKPLATLSWVVGFPGSNRGSCDIQPDRTQTIDPGAYGDISVKSRSHLKLRAGTYYFTSLSLEPSALLDVDNAAGPVFVDVRNAFAWSGTVVATQPSKGNILFALATTGTVNILTAIRGIIVAPSTTLTLASDNVVGHVGSFFAKTLDVRANAVIHQRPLSSATVCPGATECSALCACAAGGTCRNDSECNAGLSCQAAPGSSKKVCTPADKCNPPGGPPVVCTALDQCHLPGACESSTGVCTNPTKANGSACSDANACTGPDTCQAGSCTAGPAVAVDDGNPCTVDSCRASTGVTHTSVPVGTTCLDGDLCNGTETCNAAGDCTPGTPVVCLASDQCHDSGSCNPSTGICSNPPKSDGASCSDGNVCTENDGCQAGACASGPPAPVDDGNPCTTDACDPGSGVTHTPVNDGTPCPDSNACNGSETCESGVCMPGAPVTCPDPADQCHLAGTCDPATGLCTNPPKPDGSACDDADACTDNDKCVAGACTSGGPRGCDDSDPCTIDECDKVTACNHVPLGFHGPTDACVGNVATATFGTDGGSLPLQDVGSLWVPPGATDSADVTLRLVAGEEFDDQRAQLEPEIGFWPDAPRVRVKSSASLTGSVLLSLTHESVARPLPDDSELQFVALRHGPEGPTLEEIGGFPCAGGAGICALLPPQLFEAPDPNDPTDPILDLAVIVRHLPHSRFHLWTVDQSSVLLNGTPLLASAGSQYVFHDNDTLSVTAQFTLGKNFSFQNGAPLDYVTPQNLATFTNAGLYYPMSGDYHGAIDLKTVNHGSCDGGDGFTGALVRQVAVVQDGSVVPARAPATNGFPCDSGTPATCPAGRDVPHPGGNVIEIEQDPGCKNSRGCLVNGYVHLSSVPIEPPISGVLACSGDTGTFENGKTAPHLHFQTKFLGEKVDPAPLLLDAMELYLPVYLSWVLTGPSGQTQQVGPSTQVLSLDPVTVSQTIATGYLLPGRYTLSLMLDSGMSLGPPREIKSWTLEVDEPEDCISNSRVVGQDPIGLPLSRALRTDGTLAFGYFARSSPVDPQHSTFAAIIDPYGRRFAALGAGSYQTGLRDAPAFAFPPGKGGPSAAFPFFNDDANRLELRYDGQVQPRMRLVQEVVSDVLWQGDRALCFSPDGRATVVANSLTPDISVETDLMRWMPGMGFGPDAWEFMLLEPPPLIGFTSNIAMAIDPTTGEHHITYAAWPFDVGSGRTLPIEFVYRRISGTLTPLERRVIDTGPASGAEIPGILSDVTLDALGRAHIAYVNTRDHDSLHYYGPTGAEEVAEIDGFIVNASVAVDATGRPFIAYSYESRSGDAAIETLWRRGPSDWQPVTGLNQAFSSDVVAGIDAKGILRIFYHSPDGLTVASRNTRCVP